MHRLPSSVQMIWWQREGNSWSLTKISLNRDFFCLEMVLCSEWQSIPMWRQNRFHSRFLQDWIRELSTGLFWNHCLEQRWDQGKQTLCLRPSKNPPCLFADWFFAGISLTFLKKIHYWKNQPEYRDLAHKWRFSNTSLMSFSPEFSPQVLEANSFSWVSSS